MYFVRLENIFFCNLNEVFVEDNISNNLYLKWKGYLQSLNKEKNSLDSSLKRQWFTDIPNIQQHAPTLLKPISENEFQ